ncbi:MAG: 23S rRNA (uracil(1939)-C(5))-methyltransferase RlmD [Kordiimonadaceae bacterium]|nr:23S rRNA (uracil(1939)-C(5))-methyltransferase RlmD [Kordiimonadaceae bacterium]MBO6569991.1 23S rRNA (uracil(1939)-C(5))-methyltransferase RlmD [Kordiimonadaceae bacterium]MBO6965912.1 23S rRNA (uracil(1939)-C(5))-methyltransferase RlmD [Kordiimonadaceae bacterium]
MPESITVTIESLGARGDGIAKHDGKPVYVPGALPGEVVQVQVVETRKSGLYTRMLDVKEPSRQRVQAKCQHFGRCGGCQMQHMTDELYRKWVQDRARFALAQQGLDEAQVEDPFMAPPESRRRVALKALQTASGLVFGFNAEGSHQIVDVVQCPVMHSSIWALVPELKRLLGNILPQRALAQVHATLTATGIDLVVDVAHEISLQEREACVQFANDFNISAFHWRSDGFLDPIVVRQEPIMEFAGVKVPLSPGAFIQATSESEAVMIERVQSACSSAGRVADLFSGIGTFTFPLARQHQILAVEGALDAVQALENARNSAPAAGVKLKQVVVKHRDLFRRPLSVKELAGFDAVVIDPPRAGAQMQMEQLAQSGVKTVVSVSCNPNTFARDARILVEGGYELNTVLPVDQFLWSTHLELVGVFTRP